MKKLLLLAFIAVWAVSFNAQVLLDQDWQGFANGGDISIVEEPDDAEEGDWVSYDEDVLEDGSPNERPGNWYGSLDLGYFPTTEIADTNFVMASSSWMLGFAPGNRNWLISPLVEVVDGAVLRWSSSVFQTPRYADGYSVWISPTGDMTELEGDFTDKLFTQAQMVEATSWNEDYYGDIDYSNCLAPNVPEETEVCWFPEDYGTGTDGLTGYRHAEDHTLTEYLGTDPEVVEPTAYRGFLEPHTIDLSAYVGQTIRIAWLHDSDDDNLLAVDDILVEVATGVEDFAFEELVTMYPNPATDIVSLNFSEFVKESAQVSVYDNTGRLVASETYAGAQLRANNNLNVADFAPGVYSIQINIDEQGLVGQRFIKK